MGGVTSFFSVSFSPLLPSILFPRLRTRASKGRKSLLAESKRAMHSLHHGNVTRPSRPRRVVSCSSRSDGSKKRTEPTKEVKSLICQTKNPRALDFPPVFHSFSLPPSPAFRCPFFHAQSIHASCGEDLHPKAQLCATRVPRIVQHPSFELSISETGVENRVTRMKTQSRRYALSHFCARQPKFTRRKKENSAAMKR